MIKNVREAAQAALNVQDACNLSGVVRSWVEALTVLWDEAHKNGHGTDWVNQHPASKLFADKCASLAHIQSVSSYTLDIYGQASDYCEELVRQPAAQPAKAITVEVTP